MSMAGTDRVSIDPFRTNFAATPPFNGIVQAQNHRPPYRQCADQQSQQDATGLQARPLRPIQNPMVIFKMLLHAQTHHTQGRSHGSFRRRQDRTDQQNLRMFPEAIRKQAHKRSQDRDIVRLQGGHRLPLDGEFALAYPALAQSSNG